MSTYYKLGSLIEGLTTVATANGTTTLTASSRSIQIFTGTQGQTVVLPDATTLSIGRRFDINNRSSEDITVQASGGGSIGTVPAGSQRYFLVTNIGSAAGSWAIGGVQGGAGGSSGVSTQDSLNILSGLAGTYLNSSTIVSRPVKTSAEETGGNFWKTKSPLAAQRRYSATGVVNGYLYNAGGRDGSNTNLSSLTRFNDDTNLWVIKNSMSTTRGAPSGVHDGSMLYILGGGNSSNVALDTGEKYSDASDSWTSTANLTTARWQTAGCFFLGLGYVAGGGASPISSVEAYNPSANAWYTRRAQPATKFDAPLLDGGVYIWQFAGSDNSTNRTNTTIYYNPVTDTWLSGAVKPNTVTGTPGMSLFGRAYIAGGHTGSGNSTNTSHLFDYETKAWLAIADVTAGVYDAAGDGAALNGMGYQVGGTVNGGAVTANVYSYQPFAWISLGSVKKSNVALTSLLVSAKANNISSSLPVQVRTDGHSWKNLTAGSDSALKSGETIGPKFKRAAKLFLAGGYGPGGGHSTSTEMYFPESNSWATKASMTDPHTSGMARFGIDGYGLAGGGANGSITIEEYNDDTNTWAVRGSTQDNRNTCATFEIEGIGYGSGGNISGTGYVSSVYSYNRTTMSWTSRAAISSNRGYSASFALQGKGYNLNGYNGSPISTTQAYNPVTNSWASTSGWTSTVAGSAGSANEEAGIGWVGGGYNYTGGVPSDSSSWFNPVTSVWTAFNVSVPVLQYDHYADQIGGFGYSASGATTSGTTTAVVQFSLDSKLYTSKANVGSGREYPMVCSPGFYRNYEVRIGAPNLFLGLGGGVWANKSNLLVANGQKERFSIGGNIYSQDGSATQKYNTTIDVTVSSPRPIDSARTTFCADSNLNRGYLIGGYNGSMTQTVEEFNPETATWASKTSVSNEHYSGSGMALNGSLYAVSSYNNSTTERYSDVLNTWTARATVGSVIGQNVCNTVDGLGISIGGSTGGSPVVGCLFYNDAGNVWYTAPSTNVPRDYSGSTNLAGGLFVSGGSSPTATCERLNRSLNVWTYAPSMSVSGQSTNHAEGEGSSYRVGGYSGSTLSTIEKYTDAIKIAVLGLALEVK